MKLNKNIDLGKAFEMLKDGLEFAEEKARTDEDYKYANAYGRLSSAVKTFLQLTTDHEPFPKQITKN